MKKMSECPECGRRFDNKVSMGNHRRQSHTVPWKNKAKLQELYVEKGLEVKAIAERFECSTATINRHVNEFDLKRKYEDKEWLLEKYIDEGLKIREIAELTNVSYGPIQSRLSEMDVELRNVHSYERAPWRNKDKFKELYVDRDWSICKIAKHWECNTITVWRWIEKHGFEKRGSPIGKRVSYAHYFTDKNGYVRWVTDGEKSPDQFFVHRLIAISEYGADAVCGKDVHHKNEIPWDNRPKNLELLTRSEHMKVHYSEKGIEG